MMANQPAKRQRMLRRKKPSMLRKWLQIGAGVIIASVIVGYAIFQFQDLLSGPTITITSPQNGQTLESPLVEISGTARRVAFISLNGRQIFTNPQGEFREQLVLSTGYNIITVSAEDKFNRTTEKQLELLLSTSTDHLLYNGQKR